jgi:hypothetical protein
MEEQTKFDACCWVRWSLVLLVCAASSGCSTVTHYLYHHTPIHMIFDSNGYFHCAHCGALVPCDGSPHACHGCPQPPFHGFTQTQWQQWIPAAESCGACQNQAPVEVINETTVPSSSSPAAADRDSLPLAPPELDLPSGPSPRQTLTAPEGEQAPTRDVSPSVSEDSAKEDSRLHSPEEPEPLDEPLDPEDPAPPPSTSPSSDAESAPGGPATVPLSVGPSDPSPGIFPLPPDPPESEPAVVPLPPNPPESKPAAEVRRLPPFKGEELSRLPTIELELIPPIR